MVKRRNIGSVVAEEHLRERRKALRALLQKPLITANGPDGETFILIRRHAKAIGQWLALNLGWRLNMDNETVRLYKLPPGLDDPTRGAATKKPMTRRRYALFCLSLAALGQGERQTTLGKLFERILQLAMADEGFEQAGFRLDPNLRDHRRDLVAAVHLMLDLGLLHEVDGDEDAYLSGRGDVLYNVNRSALSWVLNVRRAPSTVEAEDLPGRMEAITAEPLPANQEGRNRATRLFLNRKLVDDPVLYHEDLSEEQLTYLNGQRGKIIQGISEFTGLHAEVRKEGMAMVDEGGELTDLDMPSEGTDGHITLLVAEFLGQQLNKRDKTVGRVELEQYMTQMVDAYGKYWRKGARNPEALSGLVSSALERLLALDLIAIRPNGIQPRPALARYNLDEPRIKLTVAEAQGELPI